MDGDVSTRWGDFNDSLCILKLSGFLYDYVLKECFERYLIYFANVSRELLRYLQALVINIIACEAHILRTLLR